MTNYFCLKCPIILLSKTGTNLKRLILESLPGKWLGKYIPLERIFSGVFWTAMGNVVSSLASFVSAMILAKVLGAFYFGQFSVLQSTLSVFMILGGPSLGFLATKYIAKYKHLNPSRAAAVLKLSNFSALALSAVMTIALLILSPYLSGQVLRAPELLPELWLSSAILLFAGVNGAQLGALTGFEAFKEVAKVNILKGVLTLLLITLGGYYDGVRGAISGLAIVSVLICAFSNHYVTSLTNRYKLPTVTNAEFLAEVKLLFSFSLPNWLFSMVASLSNLWTHVMLSRAPQGFAQMGIFSAANQFFLMLNFLPMIIWQVTLPMLSGGLNCKKDFVKLRRSYRKLIAINLAVIALLLCLIVPLAGMFMAWLGKDFTGQTRTLVVTLVTTLFYASANVAWQVMIVLGRMWTSLLSVTLYSAVCVGSFIVLESMGAYGLATARLISYSIYAVVNIFYVELVLARKIDSPEGKNVP